MKKYDYQTVAQLEPKSPTVAALAEGAGNHPERERTKSPELFDRVLRSLDRAVVSADTFRGLAIPERPVMLSPFYKRGDYGIIYAPRGAGKSWLSLLIGKALSEGTMIGSHWQAQQRHKVLYLDSEMNIHDLVKTRCDSLRIDSDYFSLLSHERLFSESGDELTLNLADDAYQAAIAAYCREQGISTLILDNLSTAFHGLQEDKADSWEQVSPWILDMRRRGIAVILVCHAGRNGNIRGTSKREDAAHWIISLEEANEDDSAALQFKTRFTKCRNVSPSEVPPLLWTLIETPDGIESTTATIDFYDQFIDLVLGGYTSASEIATDLGKTKGCISKWAKKAQADKKIRIDNGRYLPA
ncbi:AAA family ATPase [Sulfuriroseicoccus oceanibius]|uniref:AAA family ATPase n=1 Tax=Sulfuriroseicoccus oceanibius TaxID=2707525 RepID=A0A6B3L568_9BACT|nr:AAA family ATPase [Sulfuriroseicoccus oceanibius]QQL44840.1 AAA family ATPase [Sulfuriroseicoccus oceanibius]